MKLTDPRFKAILQTTKFQEKTASALRYVYVDAYTIYRVAKAVGLSYSTVSQAQSRFAQAIYDYQAQEVLKEKLVPAV